MRPGANGSSRSVRWSLRSPLDVRFAPGRILQPDGFVLFSTIPPDHRGPINQIPPLCIEILSTNRVHDRVTKRSIYAEAGVNELWAVEQAGFIERWSGNAQRLRRADAIEPFARFGHRRARQLRVDLDAMGLERREVVEPRQ